MYAPAAELQQVYLCTLTYIQMHVIECLIPFAFAFMFPSISLMCGSNSISSCGSSSGSCWNGVSDTQYCLPGNECPTISCFCTWRQIACNSFPVIILSMGNNKATSVIVFQGNRKSKISTRIRQWVPFETLSPPPGGLLTIARTKRKEEIPYNLLKGFSETETIFSN